MDLGSIVEHLAEGFQVVSPEFRYLYINRVAAEHGRSSPADLIGRTMMEAYPGIEDSEMFALLREVVETGEPAQLENEFTFADGSSGWFDLRMAPVPEGVVILSIDITHTKELARQLTRSQRMDAIGQLAGGFAHDFNNLLTIIQACGTFLAEGLSEEDPRATDVEQIMDAARRGAELTKKVLSFAKRMPVARQHVDLPDTLSTIEELLRRTLGSDIALTVRFDPAVGSARIEPSALDQVLLNLALNARDAMPNGGSIVIEAEMTEFLEQLPIRQGVRLEPGRYVVIAVTDTGGGIDPGDIDHIFEPFFTTKGESHGTGLGLATSWGLVRQAGGALTVYSELDTGTTFRIYLPESRDEHRAVPERSGEVSRLSDLTGKRVIVVEDAQAIRELMARVLRGAGCRVIEVRSGAEAMLILEDVGENIDLLVTDVVMPRMSGFELANRVSHRFPELPILLISGYAPAALSAREGAHLGLPVLSKPFTPEQLREAVRDVLTL